MDLILQVCDQYVFTPLVYPSTWPEDNALRQFLSLNVLVNLAVTGLYLMVGSVSYTFCHERTLLSNRQAREEIVYALRCLPAMAFLSCLLFLVEVRGHAKLYDSLDECQLGWVGIFFSCGLFILFTDVLVYIIHRGLHHPLFYSTVHKPHHRWKVPTPFASNAFHPVDGFLQTLSYHLYVLVFPMHKYAYLVMYVAGIAWAVSSHDGKDAVPNVLKSIVNGTAHHMYHHLYYDVNYGQYFTFWDKIFGSYRDPTSHKRLREEDLVTQQAKTSKRKMC